MIVIKIRYNQYRNSPHQTLPNGRRKQQQDLIIFLQAFVTYGCFFFKFRVLNSIGYTDASHGVLLKCLIYVSIYVRDTTQAVFMLSFNQNIKNISKSIIYQREFTSSNIIIPTSRIMSKIDCDVSKH
uniref:Transmembrane protein n=1 Tax=Panagrolaimus sp. PS1159 TaxID=55785 RepID=A0AC35FU62_9BILA